MNSNSILRVAALMAIFAGSGAALAQAPVFVAAESLSLRETDAATDAPANVIRGSATAAPVLMETRGHVHADGTVSTTCAAIPSSTPRSAPVHRTSIKQQER